MANLLPSAKKDSMVSSFLEVVVGQSVETARLFLQATNWRLEDALQLFYVGDARQIASSLSYVPPVGYTPLLSDHNHSGLEERIWNDNAGQIDGGDTRPPLPVTEASPVALLSGIEGTPTVSAPTTTRRKRRTSAEMAAAGQKSRAKPLMPGIPEKATRRRRRTRAEMDAAILSSGGALVCPGSAFPTTRLRQQTHAEAASATLSTAAASTPFAPTNAPRKKRTRTEEAGPSNAIPLPSSNAASGSSQSTMTHSTNSTNFRRSKRLRGLQENCPLPVHEGRILEQKKRQKFHAENTTHTKSRCAQEKHTPSNWITLYSMKKQHMSTFVS